MRKNKKYMQTGLTLVELLVGLSIGLIVIGVAMGALIASRNISGTVSDASTLQQQASYAMRVIGSQIRQAGSTRINMNVSGTSNTVDAPVGFEKQIAGKDRLDGAVNSGKDEFKVGFLNYTESSFSPNVFDFRNCLGNSSATDLVESYFSVNSDQLRCNNTSGAGGQPIIKNVRDFQVRYLLQNASTPDNPTMTYISGSSLSESNIDKIQAIEVCLVLYGDAANNSIPAGSTYKGCDGNDRGYTDNRMHLVFRNVFQLRTQAIM